MKTRLEPRLGREGAAALYGAFLEDAGRIYLQPGCWASFLYAEPDPAHPLFDAAFPAAWGRERQTPGDLGGRLAAAFGREFLRGAPAAVAVGADHPALRLSSVREAFAALAAGADAAIIPAEDGGYCAIGLRAGVPVADVFRGMPWSTEALLSRTLDRLAAAGLSWRVLSTGYDVDRPEDLDRLRRDLGGRDPDAPDHPAATARVLARLEAHA